MEVAALEVPWRLCGSTKPTSASHVDPSVKLGIPRNAAHFQQKGHNFKTPSHKPRTLSAVFT